MVASEDPADPVALSGMPHRMWRALVDAGAEVVPVHVPLPPKTLASRLARSRGTFDGSVLGLEHLAPAWSRRRTLRVALAMGREAQARLDALPADAVLACCVSWPLYGARVECPIVYFTDGTTSQVNATYQAFAKRCSGFHDACAEIERQVLCRAASIAVSSERAAASVRHDLGLVSADVHVVPMGATVVPSRPLPSVDGLSRPSRGDLRLLIVASDPIRKRVDFALDTMLALRERGHSATLTIIGADTPRSRDCADVNRLGRLRLGDPADLQRHREALAHAHFLLQPSSAELFGIAPCEAAHFGRPSIVSDVGGLPTAVLHGQTGLVLPLTAGPTDYADAIETLVDDPPRYARLSAQALARAQLQLTWSAWARRVLGLLSQAAGRA